MAKVTIELVFDDATKNRQETFEMQLRSMGTRMLTTIENAVEKKFKEEDWVRWNLINVER